MKIIAHRGNIDGRVPEEENSPLYIDNALKLGFDAEIDVWLINNELYLGHDNPKYKVKLGWILWRKDKLWIHCKNTDAVAYFNELNLDINYFFHENDLMTLTSKTYMWVYPGNQPIYNSVAVLPEINNDNTSQCLGVCTDFTKKYQNES